MRRQTNVTGKSAQFERMKSARIIGDTVEADNIDVTNMIVTNINGAPAGTGGVTVTQNSVSTTAIQNDAVTLEKIAEGEEATVLISRTVDNVLQPVWAKVTGSDIAAATIQGGNIALETITGNKLLNDAVGIDQIAGISRTDPVANGKGRLIAFSANGASLTTTPAVTAASHLLLSTADSWELLAPGTNTHVLTSNGTTISWQPPSGGGGGGGATVGSGSIGVEELEGVTIDATTPANNLGRLIAIDNSNQLTGTPAITAKNQLLLTTDTPSLSWSVFDTPAGTGTRFLTYDGVDTVSWAATQPPSTVFPIPEQPLRTESNPPVSFTSNGNDATGLYADNAIATPAIGLAANGSRVLRLYGQNSGSAPIEIGQFAKVGQTTSNTVVVNNNIAIGTDARSGRNRSQLQNPGTDNAEDCIAIGTRAAAFNSNTIAIGANTFQAVIDPNPPTNPKSGVIGQNSIAIGANPKIVGANVVALGNGIDCTPDDFICLGNDVVVPASAANGPASAATFAIKNTTGKGLRGLPGAVTQSLGILVDGVIYYINLSDSLGQ